MSQHIIIFKNAIDSDSQMSIAGFKIMDSKLANASMKIIQKLTDKNIQFQFQNQSINYDIQKFESFKLSLADFKFLEKFFDIDCENGVSVFGVFPDILNDAYQNQIITDQQFDDLSYLSEIE